MRSSANAQILDVSDSTELKGIAYIMRHAQPVSETPLASQKSGLYEGYKRSGMREGYEVGEKTDIEWAGMPGFHSELIAKKPSEQRSMLSIFGLAQDGIFSVTFVSLEEGRELRYGDELVQNYLKRLTFIDVMPVKSSVENDEDYQMGYLVGRMTFPFVVIFLGLGMAFGLKRLLKAKKRPTV